MSLKWRKLFIIVLYLNLCYKNEVFVKKIIVRDKKKLVIFYVIVCSDVRCTSTF